MTRFAIAGVLLLAACETKELEDGTMPGSVALASSAASGESTAAPEHSMVASAAAPTSGASLTLVADRSLVCMVNNQYMGKPQIPVEVGGRTYYGCCEMCKKRLAEDASARSAIDPISGRSVDKATAVIGQTGEGATVYFESAATFAAYADKPLAN